MKAHEYVEKYLHVDSTELWIWIIDYIYKDLLHWNKSPSYIMFQSDSQAEIDKIQHRLSYGKKSHISSHTSATYNNTAKHDD